MPVQLTSDPRAGQYWGRLHSCQLLQEDPAPAAAPAVLSGRPEAAERSWSARTSMPSRAACWPGDTARHLALRDQLPGGMAQVRMKRACSACPQRRGDRTPELPEGAAVCRWHPEEGRLGAQAAQLRQISSLRTAAFRWLGIMDAATQARVFQRSPTQFTVYSAPSPRTIM